MAYRYVSAVDGRLALTSATDGYAGLVLYSGATVGADKGRRIAFGGITNDTGSVQSTFGKM